MAKDNTKKEVKKDTKKEIVVKKKSKKQVNSAICYVNSSFNNTKVVFTDLNGEVLCWSSAGIVGFKGTKKGTVYAATKVGEDAFNKAQRFGVKEARIIVKGLGQGRQSAIKGLRIGGLRISVLIDKTSVPHGGVTPKKIRKV